MLPGYARGMLRGKSRRILLAVICGLLVLGFVLWAKGRNSAPPFTGPNPNAYDTFVRAGRLLQDIRTDVPADEMSTFLQTNSAVLKAIREGLEQQFEAPAPNYDQFTLMDEIGGFKGLGLVLKMEGLRAETEKSYADASRVYLDVARLGQKIERGPLIFFLVGAAIEQIGLRSLEKIEPKLKESDRLSVSSRLVELNGQRIPFAEVVERERYFGRRNSATPLHYLVGLRFSRAAIRRGEEKYLQLAADFTALAQKMKEGEEKQR